MGEKPAKHSWNPTHHKQTEDEPVFMLITGPALTWNDVLHLLHDTTIISEKVWMSFPAFISGNSWVCQLFRATGLCQQTSSGFYLYTNQSSVHGSLIVCCSHDRGYFPSRRYFPECISRGIPPLTEVLRLFVDPIDTTSTCTHGTSSVSVYRWS